MANVLGNNSSALKKGHAEPPLTPGRPRIYSMRFCPWSERVVLYAAAKGIEVEIVNINFASKPEWYFNKHKQGKVPTLEIDGKIVIESAIIAEFLDGIYPSSAILPIEPYLKAHQKILLEQASPISAALYGVVGVFQENLQGEVRDERVKALEEAMDTVENLLKTDYFGGSSAGYTDWMLFPFIERISLLSPLLPLPSPFPSARWPSLSSWWGRISAHPAATAVVQPKELHIAYSMSIAAGKRNFDVGL